MADDLRDILDTARRAMPDVPDDTWARLEQILRHNFGAQRHYFAARKKGRMLAELEAGGETDATRISQMIGISVRHARRLKKLI